MATTAITYRTSGRKHDLRTVVVEDVARSVVLLPSGSLDVVMAKLLCGTTDRCSFWTDALGTEPDDHQLIVPASQVVAERPIQIAVKVVRHK